MTELCRSELFRIAELDAHRASHTCHHIPRIAVSCETPLKAGKRKRFSIQCSEGGLDLVENQNRATRTLLRVRRVLSRVPRSFVFLREEGRIGICDEMLRRPQEVRFDRFRI